MIVNKHGRTAPVLTLTEGDSYTHILKMQVARNDSGYDLSPLSWTVNVKNAEDETDIYPCTVTQITDDLITIDWQIFGKATSEEGVTQFQLQGFTDNETGGDPMWTSGIYALQVKERLNVSASADEESELSAVQQMIVYLNGELSTVLSARDSANLSAENADRAAASAIAAADSANQAAAGFRTAAKKMPSVTQNGTWAVWDDELSAYQDTGVSATGPKGDAGPEGPKGDTGAGGFSPVASVSQNAEGALITITDENGTTTAQINNGADSVLYTAQSLTSAQKSQARDNIGAGSAEDVETLMEEVENLKNDKLVEIPYELLLGKRCNLNGIHTQNTQMLGLSEHMQVIKGMKIIAPDPSTYKYMCEIMDENKTSIEYLNWMTIDTTITRGSYFYINVVRQDNANVTETDMQAVYSSMKFVAQSGIEIDRLKADVEALKQTALKDLGGKIEYVAVTGNVGGLVSNCAESLLLTAHCGLHAAEVDIRLTSDGIPVLAHSEDLSTFTDAPTGTLISSVTAVQIKNYQYNMYEYMYNFFTQPVRLTTLAECIDICKRYGMRLYLDIKNDGYDGTHQTELLDAVINAATQAGIDGSCCFISTNQDSRLYIREKLPHAIIGYKTYVDSTTAESDIQGISEIGGNVMLQAETLDGSTQSVLAALTANRIAAYREYNLPIKDIDYCFTFTKPDECRSGIRYTFYFTTSDGGTTWTLLPAQSSSIASTSGATLTNEGASGYTSYLFTCPLLNGDLLRTARPTCEFRSTGNNSFGAWYTDTGIRFVTNTTSTPTHENARIYVNF